MFNPLKSDAGEIIPLRDALGDTLAGGGSDAQIIELLDRYEATPLNLVAIIGSLLIEIDETKSNRQ